MLLNRAYLPRCCDDAQMLLLRHAAAKARGVATAGRSHAAAVAADVAAAAADVAGDWVMIELPPGYLHLVPALLSLVAHHQHQSDE